MVEKLLDVCDFQGGTQPPKDEWVSEPKDGYIRMLQIRDYTQGDEKFIEYVLDNGKLHKCTEEDIMLSRYGYIGQAFTGLSGAYNVALVKVIKKKPVHNPYLLYYFKSGYFQHHLLDNVGARATIPGFNKSELKDAVINIPNQEKQEYISGNLRKIEGIIALRQQELQKLDNLIKARFVELFGDAVDNPMGWEKKQLQEIVTDDCTISYGIVQTGDDQEEGVPVFRPVDIVNRVPKLNELKKTTEEISNKYKRTILKGREMLITVRANIADTCIVGEEFRGCNVGRGIVPIRTKEDVIVLEFLKYLMDSKHLNDEIKNKAKGITLIQLNMEDLREVELIIPPLEQQKAFVEFAEQVDKSKFVVQKAIDEAQWLYDSLMQKYFG